MFIVDIIILIIIGIFALKGLKNGLIIELGSVIALIAGLFLASKLSVFIFDILSDHDFSSIKYLSQIVYSISFILIVIAVFFIAKLLTNIAKFIKINWLNKFCGLVFGLFKGILIIGGLIFIFLLINSHFHFIEEEPRSFLFIPLYKIFVSIFSLRSEFFALW